MTNKPYTDADVKLVAAAMWRVGAPENARYSRAEVARIALDALAAAGRLAPADDDPRHIVHIRPDGWTIKHPLACRPDLFNCPVNRVAGIDLSQSDGAPVPPGFYQCSANDLGDRFLIGDRVDQADDCPCLPGTPPHAHGTGGYATGTPTVSIERPDDERIEIHINGQEVAAANHDEHGWSGMDAVERTALAVARACGAHVDQGEG